MLIGIILFVVFIALLVKAILETIWGVCLIIQGFFWRAIGYTLDVLIFLIRAYKKVTRKFCQKPKPTPIKFSTARAINLYFSRMK